MEKGHHKKRGPKKVRKFIKKRRQTCQFGKKKRKGGLKEKRKEMEGLRERETIAKKRRNNIKPPPFG